MTTKLALLSVIYTEQTSFHATLRITSHMTEDDMTTILHERIMGGAVQYELLPFDNFRDIQVADGECLAIMVRNAGEVAACGIFQVTISLSEELGAVLAPRCIQNLLIDQCDAEVIAATTGELSQEAGVAQ